MAGAITVGLAQQSLFEVENLVWGTLWLGRIRQARHDMLVAFMESPSPRLAKRLAGLERYEKPIRAARRRVLKRWLKQE
ncbi:hypothetical protein CVM73_08805 [Bradyrhizobium forestalis]|uniref:Uncharacterized protein n=1 Tax=Bradyrhizobium forestalis TaxID=1419263 RepID=A0A2M8RCU7_9BRAD|nr:hypothetical protein CVM73_08805 [Bradyrhizobium forestalis]